MRANEVRKGDELEEAEDALEQIKLCKRQTNNPRTQRSHVLARANWLEADKGHLHASQGTDRVPRRVRDIQTTAETTHENECQCMQRNHVRDKRITACEVLSENH